jgi:hypothetical protein
MDWSDEPATWKQVRFLKQKGYRVDHALTKIEADEIITTLGGSRAFCVALQESDRHENVTAEHWRSAVDHARQALAAADETTCAGRQRELSEAVRERQEFWRDTCRDTCRMRHATSQVLDLYRTQGCLFWEPGPEEVQTVLNALDAACPDWDANHLELFYETLCLNFPSLFRYH